MSRFELPEGRTAQLTAASLTIITIFIFWLGLVKPLISLYNSRENVLADQTERVDHLAILAARLPVMRAQLVADLAKGPVSNAFLDGTTDGTAEANLQRIVEQLAAASETALSSFEAAPVRSVGLTRRIGVSVGATCRYESLVRLLVAIEQSSPKLLVDDLQIHDVDAGGVDKSHPIEASFTVYAFRRSKAGPDLDAP